jgi:hypothetical protein
MFEGRSRRAADETALNSVVDGKAPICPAERVRRQFKARTLGAASILTPRQNTRCASLDDLDPDLAAHVLDALEEPLEGKGSVPCWRTKRGFVSFTETRTCFGGCRRWFECPRCGRACRVLFGVPYRCRRCHGLQYSSQYQSAGSRTIGRLQAIRTRLGGSGDLFEPFPARPKHMQRRTYMRLRAMPTG